MMTTFLSLIKIMFALVAVCYSWSSASTLSGSPLASNSSGSKSSHLNGASPQPSPLPRKSPFSSGLAWGSDQCYSDIDCIMGHDSDMGIPGSVCVDGQCLCPVGYNLAFVGPSQACTEVTCDSDWECFYWQNAQCSNHKCVCSPGYRQEKIECEEIPTEPPITTTSTTSSTTSSTTTSTTPSTTTSSTSSTTSSTGCKPSDCSRVCQANAVCMKKSYACACDCPIGFKQRIEGPIVYCDPHDCAQEKLGCYWLHTFCRGADHKCACMHGYQLDPNDPSTCEPIPGWTTASEISTSTDVSAKVGAFLWKTILWIIGIVVVIFLVAMCITIVVCCFCCKSDKSKQARYNNYGSMTPSKYPQVVPYPGNYGNYGKGGPILVQTPGTSGFKGSNAVGSGSKATNLQYPIAPSKFPLVASTPSGYADPKKKPILASNPGKSRSKGSKGSKAASSKVTNPPYPI